MSNQSPSLKEQNAWLIRVALVLHAVAFAYVAFEPFALAQLERADALDHVKSVIAPGSLSLGIIVLAKLVLLGLFPARLRDRLVHWRWRDPLPGSRAFTKFGSADSRIDMAVLQQNYGHLPTKPSEQGSLFYKIYSAHANDIGVIDAHKSYLAARDICVVNFILLIILPVFACWATGDSKRTVVYISALLGSYVIMALAAQTYGGRLVENSLAAASGRRS